MTVPLKSGMWLQEQLPRLYQMSGEKNIAPLLDGVDKIKLAKIAEFAKETDESARPVLGLSSISNQCHSNVMSAPEKKMAVQEHPKCTRNRANNSIPWTTPSHQSTLNPKRRISSQGSYPAGTITILNDPVWKTRLTAMEELVSKVDQMCYTEGFDTELLVLFLEQASRLE